MAVVRFPAEALPRGVMRGLATLAVAAQPALMAQAPVASQVPPPVPTAGLVLDGVTVVDVADGKLVPSQRVVVVGNRIQAVGDIGKVEAPEDARVVEAAGKYLIPGLWDLHVHPRRSTAAFYPLFVANGVTGIRDAGSEVPIDTLQLWRREILAGTRVGPPRQLLSGQSIAGPRARCKRTSTNRSPQTCVVDEADARHYVDSLHAAGADMIKPRAVSRALYFVIAAEARRLGIPFGGHAQQETAIEVADSGAVLIDHMQHAMGSRGLRALCWASVQSASVEQCEPVAKRLREQGTWFVATLAREGGSGGAAARGIAARFRSRAQEYWAGSLPPGNWLRDSSAVEPAAAAAGGSGASSGAMHIMQAVGLPIVAGTDAGSPVLRRLPPGFALHAELAMYVAEGLTPVNALQSATLNPAKMLGATDSLGTVSAGKLADLVLLDADPLADITNTTTIRAVVANGQYYDRAALDGLLAGVREGD